MSTSGLEDIIKALHPNTRCLRSAENGEQKEFYPKEWGFMNDSSIPAFWAN